MDTVEKCGMCKQRDLEEVSVNPDKGFFKVCPNCDDPKGRSPKD